MEEGSVFVGHSGSGYAWVFSLAEQGGTKNLLYEGHVRGWWLEGDQLLYAQERDLFAVPQTGGPPSRIDHFGDNLAAGFSGGVLDRDALFWESFSSGVDIAKHTRGGSDALLARVPTSTYQNGVVYGMTAAGKSLLLNCTANLGGSVVVSIAKDTGVFKALPDFGKSGRLLATSNEGAILWSSEGASVPVPTATGFVYVPTVSYGRSTVGGDAVLNLTTNLPASAEPMGAWAAGGGAWYVALAELAATADQTYLSYWYVAADGTAERRACDPTKPPSATSVSAPVAPGARPVAGVAADGALYTAVVHPDGRWVVARVARPGATAPPPPGDGAGSGGAGGASGTCSNSAGGISGATTGHTVTEFALPKPNAIPSALTSGTDGNVWFTEPGVSAVAKISPSGCVTEIRSGISYAIVATSDGHVWFSDIDDDIVRMAMDGTMVRPYHINTGIPRNLVLGTDGLVWFTQAPKIGRLSPDGTITSYALTGAASGPSGLARAGDGTIWFSDEPYHNVGSIDPATGAIRTIPVPAPGTPGTMIAAPDGNIWFQNAGVGLTRVTTTGVFTNFSLPAGTVLAGLAAGPDGNIWFTNYDANTIGRLSLPGGTVDQFPLPTAGSQPTAITAGPDGNLWFAEIGANKIGRITPH